MFLASPLLMPQSESIIENSTPEEENQNGLRRRSSQIISADSKDVIDFQGRPREDSITAFKLLGKSIIY